MCLLYLPMTDLPLDPHDYPGTPEYNELLEERTRRAYLLQQAMKVSAQAETYPTR